MTSSVRVITKKMKLLLLVLAVAAMVPLARSTHSVRIRGRLLCYGKPLYSHLVHVYEHNFLFPDVQTVEALTDTQGYVDVSATGGESFIIESAPYLYVRHDCPGRCDTLQVVIPDYYVNRGHLPRRVFNFGDLEIANNC
ncbi:unnamed protein product [Caenorhabditis bovis]|uniref:Transthyretin-like family protein n=1 Tax=Caenorhabditis bovis TaxID=2654633 RepID=A0A8S1EG65_9PELO|nr:unnamed protein product [Caenorhabditis bovis]